MTNTDALEIALIKSKVTKKELAKKLGISLQTLYNKMGNSVEFKASEIFKTSKILNLSDSEKEDIFFAQVVDQ